MKVGICCPTVTRPYQQCLDSIERAYPLATEAGIDLQMVVEEGNPYISAARSSMLRKAMDAKCDAVVFLDHDIEFEPEGLLKLIQTEGDVVAGLYRFKKPEEEYMGALDTDPNGYALGRADGAIKGHRIPAGFLKVTRAAVERFMRGYPALVYGSPIAPAVDLFNHGAFEGVWWGEDYAFSRNWLALGEPIWIVPDLTLTHHTATEGFVGNYHNFLRRQLGGDLAETAS